MFSILAISVLHNLGDVHVYVNDASLMKVNGPIIVYKSHYFLSSEMCSSHYY